MAFSKGMESTEGAQVKRYVGVGSMYIKGVNPTKEEQEKFYGREVENTPEYTGQSDNGVPYVRISFLAQADPEKYADTDFKTNITFFLRREARVSKDGKKQVIDKYGRTAWATEDEITNKRVPVYGNGKPANLDAQFRVAYSGEEDLIKFLIAYLNIPAPANYLNGEWVNKPAEELPDCEACLEHIEDYFKGNFKELKEIISYQPNNKVKVAFGIRTADDGREFQTCYTRMFLRNSSSNYARLDKDIKEAKNNGAFPTTVFDTTELHEYVVTPTNFATPETTPAPTLTPWD